MFILVLFYSTRSSYLRRFLECKKFILLKDCKISYGLHTET
uniref:Uncharacterized protein n=1 Tax=Rhizophora mucronata TaxID=61149 RepID=A0A2P2NAQ4_RHIMU